MDQTSEAPLLAEAHNTVDDKVVLKERGESGESSVSTSPNNPADSYDSQGQYARTALLYESELEAREASLGEEHPDVATTLTNLALQYYSQGEYARAKPLFERALTIYEAAHGENHPHVATALNNLALLYSSQGDYARALTLLDHALTIYEAAHGENHPHVATALINLAGIYKERGQYERAEPLYVRALEIPKDTGEGHPNNETALNNLALLYISQGEYARALPLLERALKTYEVAHSENHPDVAIALTNLAGLYYSQGEYARAEPLFERALKIFEATLGENHPKVAHSLNNLAGSYEIRGQYERAEPLYVRALNIFEATLGDKHPDVATALNDLAHLYASQGDYVRAEPLYGRALNILEAALGEDHPDVATALNNLAGLYDSQGQYARAEPLYKRSLKISKAALGENHPQVATALNNLAVLYDNQGQHARAEPMYERALKIRKAAFGENHPEVAQSLNNLAWLYMSQGQYGRAEPLYERALKIYETSLGESHPKIAGVLNNLAGLHRNQKQYTHAESLYRRALKIYENSLGESHPEFATILNNLAGLYADQGRHARAESMYERALTIRGDTLGENHPYVASVLNNLAALYKNQGQHARAESLYERALKILDATLGEENPRVTILLNNFARLRLSQQRLNAALPLLRRAFTSNEQHLRKEVFGLSEKRLISFLQMQRNDEELLYVAARSHPGDRRILSLALASVLLRKGRSVQEIANTSQLIYRKLEHSDRERFDRLRSLRTQLATLSLAGPGSRSPADYQQRLKKLASEGDSLEADLARRSAPLRRFLSLPTPDQIVPQVRDALPDDGILIEFIAYLTYTSLPKPGFQLEEHDSTLRYLALLLFPDGRIRAVDLGLAEPINQAVLRLLNALAGNTASYLPAAQDIYTRVFGPLVPYLGEHHRLFLSPDDQLNLVPFAALYDGHRFLVESFDINYLTSGKDLLPRPEPPPSARSVIILADPDFRASPVESVLAMQVPSALIERSASMARFFSTLRSQGLDVPWPPLPGTRLEAQAIQRLLPNAQVLLGAEATKQALLKLSTPGLLHIATHGFFLEDSTNPPGVRAPVSFGAIAATPVARPADPLLRSGLVLAGAHPQGVSPGSQRLEDSLVTALELAGLNLWGTQLVILSACDTGRGDVKRGEGVYGLRRALLVAGAETVVTSLWKVNDEVTRQLMEGYYRHLLAGQGRTRALHEAMRELRRQHPHPHYWAAFTALGSDAPLHVGGVDGNPE